MSWYWTNSKRAKATKAPRRRRRHWYGPFNTRAATVRYARVNGWRNAK